MADLTRYNDFTYRGVQVDHLSTGWYYARIGQGVARKTKPAIKREIDRRKRSSGKRRRRNPVSNPMKKNEAAIWLVGIGVVAAAGVGVWAYEAFYAATTINPGAISMATPSSGSVPRALPSGARSWTSATLVSIAGATATQPAVPASPTSNLTVGVQKGAILTIVWTDSTGAVQTSIISFT